jgi:hypothetical protein
MTFYSANLTPRQADHETREVERDYRRGLAKEEPQGGTKQENRVTEPNTPTEITYSALSMFRNCRKAYQDRHIRNLEPIQTVETLRFGALIHQCLEWWHGGANLETVLAGIDSSCERRATDDEVKKAWHMARAMMRGYANRYPKEDWTPVALEKPFSGPIINPETGAASRSYVLSGKVDGIVSLPDGNYVLEHKTASSIDGDYIDKLWTDFQITLYAHYVERCLYIPIAGIIYNILGKTRMQQSAGETEEEYRERYFALCAKNKSGKSTATRQMPETDYEFSKRLDEKYTEPDMFHRETIFLDRGRFEILQAELWELTKALLEAKRRAMYYQNTSQCYDFMGFGRKCPYLPICKAGDNPVLTENLYQIVAPNAELRTDNQPVF